MIGHPVFETDVLRGVHLLEADAGTGKTWTIAGLVVRALLEHEFDIDRVLVVTFTNAATAELAARIRQRIAQLERLLDDRLEARDGAPGSGVDEPFCVAYAATLGDEQARRARSRLRLALSRIDEMAVHTIHGYCQRVIDEHALSIGVSRGLPIRAGNDERIARRVADWWRAEILDASPERLLLIGLASLTPENLGAAVRAIVGLPLARVHPCSGDWRGLAFRLARARSALGDSMRDECDALQRWLAEKGNVDRRRYAARHVPGWFATLRAFCDDPFPSKWPEALGRFSSARFLDRPPASSIPACCDELLAVGDDIVRLRGWIAQEIAGSLVASRAADLADAVSLGFDDLLRLVRDALADPVSGPALAQAMRERHPIALIDECQDTDALQWEIMRRVYVDPIGGANDARPGGLVLVGDPKQAIYAFRGADLHSYLEARHAAERRHRLGENQRSSRELIESVNVLFDRQRPFLVDEIDFEPAGVGQRSRWALSAGDEAARAPMNLVRLEADPLTGSLNAFAARRQAVRASVAEIARLLSCGARYGDRPLRPGDIAVLVQTHRQGAQIKCALAAAGIGAAEISRDSVLDTLECAELLRVIAAIADPADPARMRSALTTTLFGGDARSLGTLDDDASRALVLGARFSQARDDWERSGPIAALRVLLHAHQVGARLAGLRDGDRRLTNLMHLMSLLSDDEAALRGPRQALHAWARMRKADASRHAETAELRLESDEDLVRILTLHKSKGLEFPVVFLPFAWSARAVDVPSPCTRHERDASGAWHAVLDFAPSAESAQQAARERYAESLRTMYVALTRAQQRCYLFWGAANNAQFAALAWLLHDQDPSMLEKAGHGALAPEAIEQALERWRDRTNARVPGAVVLVDTPTLAASTSIASSRIGSAARPDAPATDPTATPGNVAEPGHAPPGALAARPWRGTIGAPSITTSFSAIASTLTTLDAQTGWRASDFVERPDHDQQPLEDPPPAAAGIEQPARVDQPAPGMRSSMRFRFPAGAQAGVCLHGILEQADFAAAPSPELVARWLRRCGFARLDVAEVAAWLACVVQAPLRTMHGQTIELARVPATRQVREMDFHLSGHRVSERALLEAVASEFSIEPSTHASRWSGFLRGFVDLVFEDGGRFYLVDWKSNQLGDGVESYEPAALAMAMHEHAYSLQACLYTLAVHRWLRRTVRGYDYERHFGGFFYVFLRGAGLAGAGVAQPGAQPGIYANRPSASLVARLERVFAGSARGGTR